VSTPYRVTVAPSAIQDLEDIRAWHGAQGASATGDRLIRELVAHIESLADLPGRGRVVPELANPSVREVIHAPYRIVYRIDAATVRVVRVWRGERIMDVPPG
jgi:plasmid stabilization system protein ParE